MSHTILVVDPNADALARTAKILTDGGFVVTMASSFDEAKECVALAAPDALITDVRLGQYNGLHLVIRSRADFPTMPTIVTHAVRDALLEAEVTALSAIYLVKPLKAETLIRVLRTLIDERLR